MRNTKLALVGCLAASMMASSVSAGAITTGATQKTIDVNGFDLKQPLIPVTDTFTLKNGLRVLVSEDHSVPVASVVIIYDVGARNEQKGRSGFAHLFEHMMFEGSENVAKTEYFKYIQSTGGAVNASTHPDFTDYFEKVPSNQLELALWLEADRMRSLKVTPENFENQLQTVKEEKRLRIDNQPYIPANLQMEELAYDNWSNQHAVIGSFADLEASSILDVRQFFKTHYAPNNAVMAVVGDVDSKQVRELVNKYFGTIPAQKLPGKPDVAEKPQTKQKYLKVDDPHAQMPAFWVTWKAPSKRDGEDYYALGIIEKVLSAGTSSRLYQRMVKGDQVALSADASYDERRGPGLFESMVVVKEGNNPEKVRGILWDEVDQLKKTPISKQELDKAKNQILRDMFSSNSYYSLQHSLGRGELLAQYTSFFGDPGLLDQDIEGYLKVTPADVQKAAQHILTTEGATVVDVVPTEGKAGSSESTK
jgi:predicted Zn-dependent peptidase